jgi:excinuclease ABC subunit C
LLTYSIPFSREHPQDFFLQFPAAPAVFLLRGVDRSAEPYVSKTSNLRRRLQRLLAPPESQSKRLNLRERILAHRIGLRVRPPALQSASP